MKQFDYAHLNQQMQRLAQTAAERPAELPGEIASFLSDKQALPPECAELVYWLLTLDLALHPMTRCFDWYSLSDVYQKLTAAHEDMPRAVLAYIRRHPALESEELADFLWFASLCRLAVRNAWQLAYVERLELFRAFLENMTVYAAHTVQPEAWNDEDVYLFPPELRLTYHVNRAYAGLEEDGLEAYAHYLDLAAEDCPDLQSCIDALKALPAREESPLEGMTQAQVQAYALQRAAEIKRAFQEEDWLKTAELIKAFDREGFEAGADFALLNIQCQLAQRGLLW